MRKLLRPLPKYAHKGTFGHGLLVAGSDRMPGAAVLAAKAAMRGGIGKLTVHTVRSVRNILAVSLPEAIHMDAAVRLRVSADVCDMFRHNLHCSK